MSLCAAVAGTVLAVLPGERFELSWTHSVEKIEWREVWTVEGDALRAGEARVKGSGAGMEPPQGARRDAEGWYVYVPALPPQPALNLALSSFAGPYRLCGESGCVALDGLAPALPATLELAPCDG